nr:hypothetical protein [Tanacetum cinerariifolium]
MIKNLRSIQVGSTSGIRACREALNQKKLLLHTRSVCYKKMDQDSTYMMAASKVPMLKPVIENGNAPPITKVVKGVETTIAPTTAKEKIYEPEVKGTSSSNTNTQNVAFLFSNSTSNTNGAVNTVHGVTTASTQATVVNSTTIDNLSDAVICAFFTSQPDNGYANNEGKEILEEQWKEVFYEWWQMAMLTMRARRFLKNTGKKFSMNGNETIRFNKSKVECYNCNKRGHFAKECKAPRSPDSKHKESTRGTVPMETPALATLIVDKCKTGLGYNAVPPPYTGNFMPLKPNLSFSGLEEFVNEPIVSEPIVKKPVVETSEAKSSADKPKVIRKNFGSPLIEDWISDSEDEAKSKPKIEKKTVKHSFAIIEFVKSKEKVKSPRKITVKQGITYYCWVHVNAVEGFKQIVDFLNANPIKYVLTVNPTIYTSCIEQFWATVKAKTVIEEVQLQALVDGKKVIITESTVKRDLQLEDAEDEVVNEEMDDSLVRAVTTASSIEAEQDSDEVVNEEMDDSLVRAVTTASSIEAEQDSGGGPRCQETIGDTIAQIRSENVSKFSNDSLLNMVLDLENTKTTQALEINSLKIKVKKLKKKERSRTHKLKRLYKVGLTARVDSFDNSSLENHGRFNDQENEEMLFDVADDLRGERARQEQEANIALIKTWDDIQAKVDADYQLVKKLQAEEQEELTDEEKARLFV